MRVSRGVGANPAIRYVSDVNGGLPVVLDDGTRKYVWGLGLAYAVAGTSLEVVHADRLGSVRALTDATGALIASYRTDEFGVPTVVTGTSTQPFRFTGEPQDGTGLLYLRARTYDPVLGRFLSRDPWAGSAGVPQSLDRYVYVANNPLTFADPSGLRGCFSCGPGREPKVLSCGGEAHGALDLVGVINPAADLTNAGLYLCEGDVANAALSGIAVIPGLGDALKWLGKAVLKVFRVGGKVERAVSWANLATLADHFARHGADFGARSALEYAAQASRFFEEAGQRGYLVKVDAASGTIRIYDPASNTFGAYTLQGGTRSFFKPTDPNYWQRQPGTDVP